MQIIHGLSGKPSCELGVVEAIHGLDYRYCTTCDVFHLHTDEEPKERSSAFPLRNSGQFRAAAQRRAKLTLVYSDR